MAEANAETNEKKLNIWTIRDVVGVSDKALGKITWIAGVIAVFASLNNLAMVASYALAVSVDAPLMATQGESALWAKAVDFVIAAGQVSVAVMLQLGTDFCLLFAAGLAIHKFKMTPTMAIALWVICAANTVAMKFDIYHSIKDGRIAVLKEKEEPSTEQAQSIFWMGQYADNDGDGQPDRSIPRTAPALNAVIEGAQERVTDLRELRPELISRRDDEKESGRGPNYLATVKSLNALDQEVGVEREKISSALVEKAERAEYERHADIVASWDNRPEITQSDIGYDGQTYVIFRVFGMSILSIVGILVSFAADKANEDRKKAEDAARKRSEAAEKAAATRRKNRNIRDVDFEDVDDPQIRERGIPFFEGEQAGIFAEADVGRRKSGDQHPDRAGDTMAERATEYGPQPVDIISEPEESTDERGDDNDDDGFVGEPAASADARLDDGNEPGASEAGGELRGQQAEGV